jgi:hypothetical protein
MAMNAPIVVAFISAAAAVVVPAISFYLTKSKERQADWQRYKFELYRELVVAFSGIMNSTWTPEGQRRWSEASNALHLMGSPGVLQALHEYQEKSQGSASLPLEEHDRLFSHLLWEIRQDLDIPGTPALADYNARLWGVGSTTPSAISKTARSDETYDHG